MQAKTSVPASVDEYISAFPTETQKKLEEIRATIKKAAPEAEELISYQMAAYKLKGVLVYFGGYQNHIGFYPTASGVANFKHDLAKYKTSKGAIQFPLDKSLPKTLIAKIVKFKVNENLQKEELKPQKKNKLDNVLKDLS